MSDTKWTPGPWFADSQGRVWRRDPRTLYEAGGGVAGDRPLAKAFLGGISWDNEYPVEANARLIAAAPELYEALSKVIDDFYCSSLDATSCSLVVALDALKKARGES